jgi:hypothetical protein
MACLYPGSRRIRVGRLLAMATVPLQYRCICWSFAISSMLRVFTLPCANWRTSVWRDSKSKARRMAELLLNLRTACRLWRRVPSWNGEEKMNPDVPSSMNAVRPSSARKGPDRSLHRRKNTATVPHIDAGPHRDKAHYLASLPIMALTFRDNHHAAVTIPAGEIFEVIGPAPDDRFTIVKVQGEELLVFESDLKQRGKLVYEKRAQSA